MSNKLNITGHLEIYKQYKDGTTELVFDDPNVITKGMGIGLSFLFTASGSNSILDYRIDRFQLGVSGASSLQVSSTQTLSGALSSYEEYGTETDLVLATNNLIASGSDLSGQVFALVPKYHIAKIGKSSVRYTLIVDEDTCNNITRNSQTVYPNEVGLFMKNPTGSANDRSILVAYRYFGEIQKTEEFSLIFRWTINF